MGFQELLGGGVELLRGAAIRFGEYRRTHVEMFERHHILLEPWTHDTLHWGADGTLHGTVVVGNARPPVTRNGWCPCHPLDVDPTRRRVGPENPDLAAREL